jgi:hypothetical protein
MVQEAYASYSAMHMHLWEGIRSRQLVTMAAQTPILIAGVVTISLAARR